MKLETLINELQQIELQMGGNVEVYRGDSEWDLIDISRVSFEFVDPGNVVALL